jgi:hypothetical protein
VNNVPNSRTRDDEFLGAFDDKFGDVCESIASSDDDRRIDDAGRTVDICDHVYPRGHFPTDAPTELQQPMTPFARAVSAADGSKDRRRGEDRRRTVEKPRSDERRGRGRRCSNPPKHADERKQRRKDKSVNKCGDDGDDSDDNDGRDKRGGDEKEKEQKPKRGPPPSPRNDDDGDDGSNGGHSSTRRLNKRF